MSESAAEQMHVYELPIETSMASRPPVARKAAFFPAPFLAENARWFCGLRWIVVGIMVALGLLGDVPGLLESAGLRVPWHWPLLTAAILSLANLGFLAWIRAINAAQTLKGSQLNLWAQILFDLLVLTVVAHFVGSVETYVAFAYMFHIVLACIFLPRRQSLCVVLSALVLYACCLGVEWSGFVGRPSIYASNGLQREILGDRTVFAVNVASTVTIWFIIWYLTSRLSDMVRERDSRLAETNKRIVAAQKEKTRHMLRTTHELKAPFAAIHANAQLLSKGYCGELPAEAVDVVDRISKRCRRLSAEIKEMLQLANLSSVSEDSLKWRDLDLVEVIRQCIDQIQPLAEEQHVRIEADLKPAGVYSVEDHIKMLFDNLLANAVVYSREGGHVEVSCGQSADGRTQVGVADAGIGIPASKLPLIFGEYYRTDEAVRHNKESTGLGLAIVRNVAQKHGIRVQVSSEPDKGTRFVLTFPAPPRQAGDPQEET